MNKSRFHSERGATAVLIAFSMVGLLAFGGLVLDGGNAYSQRRQMQNAADASATAGANALFRLKTGASGNTDPNAAALQVATDNKANLTSCVLVLYTAGIETGTTPCTTNPTPSNAWKVRVTVDKTSPTTLMRVVNIQSFTARGGAAAAILTGTVGTGPFVVCSAPNNDWTTPFPDSPAPPLLKLDGTLNIPAAVHHTYAVWGDAIQDPKVPNKNCGLGTDMRGLVKKDFDTGQIPGPWPTESGNKAGWEVPPQLINGCGMAEGTQIKDITPGCEFAIPICPGKDSAKDTVICTAVGRFKTLADTENGKNLYAEFLGTGLLSQGSGGSIPTSIDQGLLIIKLVE